MDPVSEEPTIQWVDNVLRTLRCRNFGARLAAIALLNQMFDVCYGSCFDEIL